MFHLYTYYTYRLEIYVIPNVDGLLISYANYVRRRTCIDAKFDTREVITAIPLKTQ